MSNVIKKPSLLSKLLFDADEGSEKNKAILHSRIEIATGLQEIDNIERVEAAASSHWKGESFCREVFSSLYQHKVADAEKKESWASKGFEILEGNPAFTQLKKGCEFSAVKSLVAASSLVQGTDFISLFESTKEDRQKENQSGEPDEQQGGGEQRGEQSKGSGKPDAAQGSGQQSLSEALAGGNATEVAERKLRKAVEEAQKKADEAEEVSEAVFGKHAGTESSNPEFIEDVKERMKFLDKINRGRMRKIAKLIGRLKRVNKVNKSSTKIKGKTKTVGVKLGNEIPLLTDESLILAASPVLKYEFYSKYLDSCLVQYKQESNKKVGRGPVVMLIDCSSSMGANNRFFDGISNMDVANAIAVTVLAICRKEGRPFSAYYFNGSLLATFYGWEKNSFIGFSNHSTNPTRIIDSKLVSMMIGMGCAGGTRLSTAMASVVGNGSLKEKADLLVLTDGHTETVCESTIEKINSLKEVSGLRSYGMVIGGGNFHSDIACTMDKVVQVDNPTEMEEVGRAL
tara:strand:+ start:69868 stop:71409 length:1542 start_codon:yes stop_codon:yes gene_type:complete